MSWLGESARSSVYVVLTRQLQPRAQNRCSGERDEHREYPNTSNEAYERLRQAVYCSGRQQTTIGEWWRSCVGLRQVQAHWHRQAAMAD